MYKIDLLIILSFLWGCLAQDYFYEPVSGLNLEDVPLGSLNRIYPQHKKVEIPDVKKQKISPAIDQKKTTEDKPESHLSQVSNEYQQNAQVDQNNKNYIQKMASQLNTAQKHVSVLSNYQKYILNQDPLVKKYVFANQKQSRYRSKQKGKTVQPESPKHSEAQSRSSITVTQNEGLVSPKMNNEEKSSESEDHTTKPTEQQYYTITTPQFPKVEEVAEPMVTFVYTPKPYPYYGLGVTEPSPTANPIFHYNTEYSVLPTYQQFGGTYDQTDYNHKSPNYEFLYKVSDFEKNNFGHMESRSDQTTYGYYYVQLPDGRLETVNYWADKTGYHANVNYLGSENHPYY